MRGDEGGLNDPEISDRILKLLMVVLFTPVWGIFCIPSPS